MPDINDLELAKSASNGDIQAFEELVNIYYKGILSVCYSVLLNNADAQDCTQDTFFKAYKNITSYDGSSSFFTWIYRIAINTSYDLIRKAKRKKEFSLDERYDTGDGEVSYEPEDKSEDIHDNLVRSISDRRVREIVAQLPEKYSRILVLKDIEGMSYKEICEIEDINEGTVKSRLFRARTAFGQIALNEDLYN